MFKKSLGFGLAALAALLQGCIGYNSALFMTKSNAGLDLDTKPPTMEVSIARREGVIAPSYEGGQTPPVLASFKVENSGLGAFFFGVGSTFAGGDAALAMATLYGDPDALDATFDSTLDLTQKPEPHVLGFKVKHPEAGAVRPFLFGTDTSFGAKIAWSGMTAQYPDTVRLGFHRKEAALAYVFGKGKDEGYSVKMPSFLATVDNSTQGGSPSQTGTKHLQYFATGDAATKLALRQKVRAAMLERADPLAQAKAEKFTRLSQNLGAQKASLKGIINAFDAADAPKQASVLAEAKRLNLVAPETTTDTFASELVKIRNMEDQTVTQKLQALSTFIQNN